jgi:hypothetical protein
MGVDALFIIDAYKLKKYIYIYRKSYIVRGKDILTFRDWAEYDRMKLLLMVNMQSVPITTSIVSSNTTQARYTRYHIMW